MRFSATAAAVLTTCVEWTSAQDLFLQRQSGGSTKVGMMYEGWHAPAYWGRGSAGLTVETVIRSNGDKSLADMRAGGDHSKGMNFDWHKEPADGFYCIYRKRSNETESSCGLPDCPNITATLTRHAKMLVDAGIDFIVADSTNIKNTGSGADALQLRPWEVLAEEWLALRKQGVRTPQIAIWQNLQDRNSNLWQAYADGAYADPAYEEMIFTDEHTGKKVFFATADPDQQIVQELEGRGLAVVTMWAQRMNFAKGEWAFFSACTDSSGGFTDSVSSDPNVPCQQHSTTNSAIGAHGTSLTVGPSWQLSYASLPFRAAGKHGGLTLRKQFEKAFAMNAAGSLDYLMVGTFNEHIAQPQPNNYYKTNPAAVSMGLEGDADASHLFVDMYGDAISRDLEPTKEDGGRQWAIFESCMRVFKSGTATCSWRGETCCDSGDVRAQWRSVFSLELKRPFADSLLTTDEAERSALARGAWSELCAPHGGAAEFCAGNNPPAADYRRGPFLLYAAAQPAPARSAPVHRCITTDARHFPSLTAGCRGLGKMESVLGYASGDRSTETPRSLRLCQRSAGGFYHSLDSICGEHDTQIEHLGFVH